MLLPGPEHLSLVLCQTSLFLQFGEAWERAL